MLLDIFLHILLMLVKMVVIDDGVFGMSCLLVDCIANIFSFKYFPTVFDNDFVKSIIKDNNQYTFNFVTLMD
jgi:hypothetical protein